MSTHLLTDFNIIRLKHSVRAHACPSLQRINDIARMDPETLKQSTTLFEEFLGLLGEGAHFVESFDEVPLNAQRMYSRRKPANQASMDYVSSCIERFRADETPYLICDSDDFQQVSGSRADLVPARDRCILKELNTKCKEPNRLLLFRGAMYESTANDKKGAFTQSQMLMMVNLPTRNQVENKLPIKMMAAPINGSTAYTPVMENIPSTEELLAQGWKTVTVSIAKEMFHERSKIIGKRKQYAIRHIGSSTIDRQMVSK